MYRIFVFIEGIIKCLKTRMNERTVECIYRHGRVVRFRFDLYVSCEDMQTLQEVCPRVFS